MVTVQDVTHLMIIYLGMCTLFLLVLRLAFLLGSRGSHILHVLLLLPLLAYCCRCSPEALWEMCIYTQSLGISIRGLFPLFGGAVRGLAGLWQLV